MNFVYYVYFVFWNIYIYKWTSIKGMRKSYVCIIKNETQPVLGPYDFRVWLQC